MQVSCLNEQSEGSCKRVFKPWEERTDFRVEPLRSCLDDDAELLLHIPERPVDVLQCVRSFDGEVKVKAFSVIGGPERTSPSTVKLYVNKDSLDFSTIQDVPPTQEFTLNEDFRGILEYPVICRYDALQQAAGQGRLKLSCRVAKFQGVHSLDMLFPESFGAQHLEVFFIGIKGERTQESFACNVHVHEDDLVNSLQRKREAVTAVYELKPMADSAKVPGTEGNSWNVGV